MRIRPECLDARLFNRPRSLEWRRDPALNAGGAHFDDGWHKYITTMWMLGDVQKVHCMVTKTDSYSIRGTELDNLSVQEQELPGCH